MRAVLAWANLTAMGVVLAVALVQVVGFEDLRSPLRSDYYNTYMVNDTGTEYFFSETEDTLIVAASTAERLTVRSILIDWTDGTSQLTLDIESTSAPNPPERFRLGAGATYQLDGHKVSSITPIIGPSASDTLHIVVQN